MILFLLEFCEKWCSVNPLKKPILAKHVGIKHQALIIYIFRHQWLMIYVYIHNIFLLNPSFNFMWINFICFIYKVVFYDLWHCNNPTQYPQYVAPYIKQIIFIYFPWWNRFKDNFLFPHLTLCFVVDAIFFL